MNYFTDEQSKEIYYSEAGDSIEIGAFEFYKGLFNKAVEVAIGEPILFAVPDWEYCLESYSGQTLCAGKNTAIHKLPLYSVKELDN